MIGRAGIGSEDQFVTTEAANRMNAHLNKDSDDLLTVPWPLPSPHLKHYTADAPDIDLRIVPLTLAVYDLGCHPKH